MKKTLRFCSRHWLSLCCYALLLTLWINALRARASYHGLYDTASQLNAVPLEKAFYGMIYFLLASVVLLLIALCKLIFNKFGKSYYAVYAGLIAGQLLATWVYIAINS